MPSLQKVEVDLGLSRDPWASPRERDVFVLMLYRTIYLAVIRNLPQVPVLDQRCTSFHLSSEGSSRLMHILMVDIPGRCTLSVVDSLVVVHHQASKTLMIYDISFGRAVSGTVSLSQCSTGSTLYRTVLVDKDN